MADASSMSLMAKLNSITSRSYIEDVIGRSADKEKLRAVFSDHFDDLSAPVSVSLGLYPNEKNVGDIVKLLRSNGIDAVPYYDKRVKDDLDCFVVDGTGIRSPFLNPKDAVKATADICEIMNADGISTSRALPVSRQNLIPAVDHTYDGQIIDIARNNPNERDVDLFLAERLNSASNEMQAVSPVSVKGRLYRGATLGDKPYALTFHRRPRDAAYATKDFAMAATYADGEKGAGFKYKKVNGKAYGDALSARAEEMREWCKAPEGVRADDGADYACILTIDLNEIEEPYVACPHTPDNVKPLSELAGTPVDFCFVGSCMSGYGDFKDFERITESAQTTAAEVWMTPATRLLALRLEAEGITEKLKSRGVRFEVPGCSLCMGNKERVIGKKNVASTSTRNFKGRMGDEASVYLVSSQLAAVISLSGRFPNVPEYFKAVRHVD